MLENSAVERYGKALFELAVEENQLGLFGKELSGIYDILVNHSDLERLLNHPRIQEDDKKDLMNKILGSEVSPLILNFIMLIIDKGRESLLKEIIKYYQYLEREARGILEVEVFTAFELTSDNQQKLNTKLSKLTGKEVELKMMIDSTLVGGIKLKIGDQIIDGSIKRHLELIKENLANIQVSQLGVS